MGDGKSFRPPGRVKRAWRLWDPSESESPCPLFHPHPRHTAGPKRRGKPEGDDPSLFWEECVGGEDFPSKGVMGKT